MLLLLYGSGRYEQLPDDMATLFLKDEPIEILLKDEEISFELLDETEGFGG